LLWFTSFRHPNDEHATSCVVLEHVRIPALAIFFSFFFAPCQFRL
jgi:hypothetical protein